MSQESQQAIMHVLQQDSPVLSSLLARLKYLNGLQTVLNQHLDAKLANRCLVANFENACLTVITNSALWATQFRFQKPTLIQELNTHAEFSQLRDIVCKIRPAPNKREVAVADHSMPPLSPHSARLILLSAKTIKYEKLQTIMEKIAQHTTPTKG